MTNRLYLDHAAATPLLPEAAEAMARGWRDWANPSSPHAEGRAARAALENARAEIAAAYGWRGEVILTSGASEAIALAIGQSWVAGMMVSKVEHEAVLRAARPGVRLPVGHDGLVDLAVLEDELRVAPAPTLVAVQWGSGETGVIQPLHDIGERVASAGAVLFVDAAQMPVNRASGDLPLETADLIAVSAHKRGGPVGIGALLVKDLALLHPSGGQERGYRAGTENLPAALGFAAALAVPEDEAAWQTMRDRLDAAIRAGGGEVVADGARRAPHVGAYRMPGVSAVAQLIQLDLAGIAVSAGSACSSGSLRSSHVLAAMHWDELRAREVIRVSFGRSTRMADIDRFAAAWTAIATCARGRAA